MEKSATKKSKRNLSVRKDFLNVNWAIYDGRRCLGYVRGEYPDVRAFDAADRFIGSYDSRWLALDAVSRADDGALS
ncbi:hypothetical protein [Ancylobacter crimeensis]|nr:hypothetical protein [Ancylobacter crimeensis]